MNCGLGVQEVDNPNFNMITGRKLTIGSKNVTVRKVLWGLNFNQGVQFWLRQELVGVTVAALVTRWNSEERTNESL